MADIARFAVLLLLLAALMACSPPEHPAAEDSPAPPPANAAEAAAPLRAEARVGPLAEQAIEGEVRFEQVGAFVRVDAELRGLDDGLYGFHIHEGRDCEDRGGHFDPADRPHGSPDEPEELRHMGDLGNLVFRDGVARYERIDHVIRLDGEQGVIGRIVVVHADRDKLLPQPAGDSGTQIACGVIHSSAGR